MGLSLQPITFPEACAFIDEHHAHHRAPVGWKYGIAVNDGATVVGVITVGRPVARMLDDGWTLEVNRCCVRDHVPHVASMLYGAAWRAGKALGYRRMLTYTLRDETGVSLVAAGWKVLYTTEGGSWSAPSRPRVDKGNQGQKVLWEAPV